MADFRAGEIAYLVESNRFIREGKIQKCTGGIYLFRFIEGGAVQVKAHRLFHTESEAQAELDRLKGSGEPAKKRLTPYGYLG